MKKVTCVSQTLRCLVVFSLTLFLSCEADDIRTDYAVEEELVLNSSTENNSGIANGVIYALSENAGSGISGTVTITDLGALGSHILINLDNTDPDTSYPTNIYLGSVAEGNREILAHLNPVNGLLGTSTTIITNRIDTGEILNFNHITGVEEFHIASHITENTGTVAVQGGIGVEVPLDFECEDCSGSVSELTLQFNGNFDASVPVVVRQEDNTIVFQGSIMPGEEFSFSGATATANGSTFGNFVEVTIGNSNNPTRIITNCDSPIGPGLVNGNFEVVSGLSTLAQGPLCDFEEERDCEECRDGVNELRFQYNGATSGVVRVEQEDGATVYNALISPNQFFTASATNNSVFGSEVYIFIDDQLNSTVNTSCHISVGPGQVAGDFTIISGESIGSAGPLCDYVPPSENECDDCDGGVDQLTLQYTGSYRACIYIRGRDSRRTFFNETLNPGDTFTISNNGEAFGEKLQFFLNWRYCTYIDTSCDSEIGPNLERGKFKVIEGSSVDGGELCSLEEEPCEDCETGIKKLKLQYTGSYRAYVYVRGRYNGVCYARGYANPGQVFTISASQLNTKVDFYLNNRYCSTIQTNCERPIGPGLEAGKFTILEAYNVDGGEICPL